MSINSRVVSLEIICDVYNKLKFDESIKNNKKFQSLDSRDQSFVKMLVLTFLRRNGEIDKIIKEFLKKPLNKKVHEIKNIIRIGITQILFLDVKDYSAVDTCVEISKKIMPGMAALVNAVLRKVSKNKNNIINNLNTLDNLPEWIKIKLIQNFGLEATKKIADKIIETPYLDIKIKKNVFKKKEWDSLLKGFNIYGETIRKKSYGKVDFLPFYDDGHWWVQNLAASLPVEILNYLSSINNYLDKQILEIGSAPGGKTLQLCENNFNVTALDISEKRIKLLNENLKRTGFKANIINKDVLEWKSKKKFCFALIDAPCSASGLLSRKPEILINGKDKNIKNLVIKQKKILSKTASFLSAGGFMIYSVCSLIKEEAENQISSFLIKNKNFKLLKINKNMLGDIDCYYRNGMIYCTPICMREKGGLDGFFIACLKREF